VIKTNVVPSLNIYELHTCCHFDPIPAKCLVCIFIDLKPLLSCKPRTKSTLFVYINKSIDKNPVGSFSFGQTACHVECKWNPFLFIFEKPQLHCVHPMVFLNFAFRPHFDFYNFLCADAATMDPLTAMILTFFGITSIIGVCILLCTCPTIQRGCLLYEQRRNNQVRQTVYWYIQIYIWFTFAYPIKFFLFNVGIFPFKPRNLSFF
jgi:hypothetical protein